MRHLLALLALPLLAAGGSPPQPVPRSGTERVEVSLVLIDVIVRDRKEVPIRGLTRGDFELIVDAKPADPASIEVFEEVCEEPGGAGPASRQEPALPGATPQPPAAQTAAPHIVVYLDFTQLSMSAHRKSILAARDYIASSMLPADRIMVLAYMKGLRLVQDFTSDKALLVSRLNAMLDDRATIDIDAFEEPGNITAVAENPRKSIGLAYALQEESRTRGSLNALAAIMPRLAGLRGRKALVLFSDLLREEPGVEYFTMLGTTPKGEGIDVYPEILRLTREANAAGVSLYTVHASGLDEHPASMTDISGGSTGGNLVGAAAATGVSSALGLQSTLAVETGGRALQRTNDIGGILQSARQDLSCYYLLGYSHPGSGDDSQHHVVLRLKDAPGRPAGLSVRYRPSFTDRSAASRRDRMLRSALEVPELYGALPVTLEAYELAPLESGRSVLVKTIVPLQDLSLLPAGEISEGRVEIRGTIARDLEIACVFKQDIAIRRRTEERLVYQTGCVLPPGSYTLTVAVLDRGATQVGAHRTPLRLEPAGSPGEASLGEVHLWARDPDALVVTSGATEIGLGNRAGSGDFLLRSERRLAKDQPGVFSFLYCPASEMLASGRPTVLQMKVLGGEAILSDEEVTITGAPEKGAPCHEIRRNLPPSSMSPGIYSLEITTRGTGSPLTRRADFAVE